MKIEEITVYKGYTYKGSLYGRFEVVVDDGTYFVIANNDDIKILIHSINRTVKESLNEPTEKFKRIFLEKVKSMVNEVE